MMNTENRCCTDRDTDRTKLNMTNTENSQVLYKFRVAGSDGKPYVVFNGVSANSWLSPVGIRINHDDRDQTTLPQRPKSSGSIMIVRHHPSPKGLDRDEVIQGIRIKKRFGDSTPEERPRPKSEMSVPSNNAHRAATRLTSAGRPNTPFNDRGFKRPALQRSCENYGHPNLELTIRSLDLNKNSKPNDTETACKTSRREIMSANRLHSDLISRDLFGGRHALSKRAKSAPPNVRSDVLKTPVSKRGPAFYWRAKSAYHRKMMTSHSDMEWETSDSTHSYKGSMLRPLLYCEDGDLKHSAGCPYKCKGCFRACLVSKDYLDKMKKRKDTPVRKNIKHRPMVKKDARFVMHMALARNQPIYKIVHGDENSRTEAWSETVVADDGTDTLENKHAEESEHSVTTSIYPLHSHTVESVEEDTQDLFHRQSTLPEEDIRSDTSCSNCKDSKMHGQITRMDSRCSSHSFIFGSNNKPTVDGDNKSVSSHNRTNSGYGHSDTQHPHDPIHCQDSNRKSSTTINSFKMLSRANSVRSTKDTKDETDSTKSHYVSPTVEEAIRNLYELECGTPGTEVASSQCSQISEVLRDHLNDSLSDESTVSLGVLSDEDVETEGDINSDEENWQSHTETSALLESTAIQAEGSTSDSSKYKHRQHNGRSTLNRSMSAISRCSTDAECDDVQTSSKHERNIKEKKHRREYDASIGVGKTSVSKDGKRRNATDSKCTVDDAIEYSNTNKEDDSVDTNAESIKGSSNDDSSTLGNDNYVIGSGDNDDEDSKVNDDDKQSESDNEDEQEENSGSYDSNDDDQSDDTGAGSVCTHSGDTINSENEDIDHKIKTNKITKTKTKNKNITKKTITTMKIMKKNAKQSKNLKKVNVVCDQSVDDDEEEEGDSDDNDEDVDSNTNDNVSDQDGDEENGEGSTTDGNGSQEDDGDSLSIDNDGQIDDGHSLSSDKVDGDNSNGKNTDVEDGDSDTEETITEQNDSDANNSDSEIKGNVSGQDDSDVNNDGLSSEEDDDSDTKENLSEQDDDDSDNECKDNVVVNDIDDDDDDEDDDVSKTNKKSEKGDVIFNTCNKNVIKTSSTNRKKKVYSDDNSNDVESRGSDDESVCDHDSSAERSHSAIVSDSDSNTGDTEVDNGNSDVTSSDGSLEESGERDNSDDTDSDSGT